MKNKISKRVLVLLLATLMTVAVLPIASIEASASESIEIANIYSGSATYENDGTVDDYDDPSDSSGDLSGVNATGLKAIVDAFVNTLKQMFSFKGIFDFIKNLF